MKKMSTKLASVRKLAVATGLVTCCLSMYNTASAQTYYSNFLDPTGKYGVTNPTGATCASLPVENPTAYADSSLTNYSFFKANTSTPVTCDGKYSFDTYLNLPPDTSVVPAGSRAGFKIRVPTGISKDSLGKYLIISSYLNGTFQEYNTGSDLLGLDAGQNGVNWFVYFVTKKPYNILTLVVDPKIIQLNTDFEFDVLYALGENIAVLPAQIANFKAAVAGKTVNLSWQSLTETNVSSYRIEKSSNGGSSYSVIGTVAAKGNSTAAISYGYTDNDVTTGNYLYRIVTVNTDGTTKATNSVSAVINSNGSLFLYPSVVKPGQTITVKTSESGMVSVRMYDAQGRMVNQQRVNSTGQFTLSTNGLSSGVYTVRVISANGNILQSKIVVN